MKFISNLTLCLLFAAVSSNILASETPFSFVRNFSDTVRTTIRSGDIDKANQLFATTFDMDVFGKRCLLDNWDVLSESERARFKDLLKKNLKKQISKNMPLTKDDVNFLMIPKSLKQEDGLKKVESILKTKEGPVNFAIYLTSKDGRYLVADYDVDGALLSRNYRGHFNYIYRKYGKEGLFAKMEQKLAEGK